MQVALVRLGLPFSDGYVQELLEQYDKVRQG